MFKQLKSIFTVISALTLLASIACAVTLARTSAQGTPPTGTFVAGDFTLNLTADGKFNLSQKGEVVVEGTYTATQDQIVFTDKQGRYACEGTDSGKYQWKLDGQSLMFTKLEDPCGGRAGGLAGRPWVRQ